MIIVCQHDNRFKDNRNICIACEHEILLTSRNKAIANAVIKEAQRVDLQNNF